MSEMTKRDLKPFFDGWFHSYRLPDVYYSDKLAKSGNGYDLEFNVNQREGIFVFPLDVQWEENKKKIKRQIIVSKKAENFVFHLENEPKKIKINQDKIVPGRFSKK
jgi:aminopeptidase N